MSGSNEIEIQHKKNDEFENHFGDRADTSETIEYECEEISWGFILNN